MQYITALNIALFLTISLPIFSTIYDWRKYKNFKFSIKHTTNLIQPLCIILIFFTLLTALISFLPNVIDWAKANAQLQTSQDGIYIYSILIPLTISLAGVYFLARILLSMKNPWMKYNDKEQELLLKVREDDRNQLNKVRKFLHINKFGRQNKVGGL